MNIFKTFKLTWWQAAVLKLTTLTLGIAIVYLGPASHSSLVRTLCVECLVEAVDTSAFGNFHG